MSKRRELSDIEDQKRLLVAKADLQRSTLLMLASPVFRVVQAAEIGVFAAKTGQAFVRRVRK